MQRWIWTFPDMATLDAQFDEAKIAIGEVRTMEHLADSEWAEYWGATCRVPDRQGGEYRLPGPPWKFSEAELPAVGAPSEQGEQNESICQELGFSEAEITALTAGGSLVGNFTAQMIAMVSAQLAAKERQFSTEIDEEGAHESLD